MEKTNFYDQWKQGATYSNQFQQVINFYFHLTPLFPPDPAWKRYIRGQQREVLRMHRLGYGRVLWREGEEPTCRSEDPREIAVCHDQVRGS